MPMPPSVAVPDSPANHPADATPAAAQPAELPPGKADAPAGAAGRAR